MQSVEEENQVLLSNFNELRRLDEGKTSADGERAIALARESTSILFPPENEVITEEKKPIHDAANLILEAGNNINVMGRSGGQWRVTPRPGGESEEVSQRQEWASKLQVSLDSGVDFHEATDVAAEKAKKKAMRADGEMLLLRQARMDNMNPEKKPKNQLIEKRIFELKKIRSAMDFLTQAHDAKFEDSPQFARIRELRER